MDENMPKMNGSKATLLIREYEKYSKMNQTTIVALTVSTTKEDKKQFVLAGMDGYLSKPIQINKLLEIFTKYL